MDQGIVIVRFRFKKKTLNKIYIQLETYSLIAIISLSLYIKIFSQSSIFEMNQS